MNINTTTQVKNETAPIEFPKQGVDQKQQNASPAKEKEGKKLSLEETKDLTENMNELMDDLQTSLGFSIREELNHQVVVQIKNKDTNELIKQIPSEELLDIKERMEELTGMLFDKTV